MKTYVIGDVHGCHEELLDLMDKCQVTSSDRIISLGDYTDRGLYPRECVEFFMQHEAILANHEEKHLRYYDEWLKKGKPDRSTMNYRTDYHKTTFESLEPRHFEWMRTLPKFLRLPEYTAPDGLPIVLIHAGCVPDVPLEEQSDGILMHIGNVEMPPVGTRNEMSHLQHGYWTGKERYWWTNKAPAHAPFWGTCYDGSLGHIVFGHTGFEQPALFPHSTGIDTGAVFGRTLTALVLPDWRFVSVPARHAYKTSSRIQLYEVAPGISVYS